MNPGPLKKKGAIAVGFRLHPALLAVLLIATLSAAAGPQAAGAATGVTVLRDQAAALNPGFPVRDAAA